VIVRLNGSLPEEVGRTVVLLHPKYILIREDDLPTILGKSRSVAFAVLPAVGEGILERHEAGRVLSRFAESPDHVLAVADGGTPIKYHVHPTTDILPLHVRLYLEPGVPDAVGPLVLAFKRADAEVKELQRRLGEVSTERALIFDRVNVEGELASRLPQLADEEASLRRRLKQALMERGAAWKALFESLEAVGLSHLLGKLHDGVLKASIPLLKYELEAGVKHSAASAASLIYRHVLKLMGHRKRHGLFEEYALHHLIRDINLARVRGTAESAVWVRTLLKVRAGERFTAYLSLNGNSDGICIIDAPCMPDIETLPRAVSDAVRGAYGGTIVVRAEDVEKLLGHIKPIGESAILLPAGLKAVVSFKPAEAEIGLGDGP
jgi:hypothetical protein